MVLIIRSLLAALALLVLAALDLAKKVDLTRPLPLTVGLLLVCNGVLGASLPGGEGLWITIPAGLFLLYWWLRLSIAPVRDGSSAPLRAKVMIGGRFLVYAALWGMALELLVMLLAYPRLRAAGISTPVLVANGIWAAVMLLALLCNGMLRIFFTSRRVSILRRVVMVATMWIPLVNLVVLALACRLVAEEYDYALYKGDLSLVRVDSGLCQTRYPLVMVHGILFRDLKFFNYWGRIPKELTRCGATVYYGNQSAVGTVVNNAEEIRRTILRVVEETGCEKVNIIAHSKGGLDARYAVSALGMDRYVASLTTIGTPHRGCRFVDKACRLPEKLYRLIAKVFDTAFGRLWKEPSDFYTATRQFSTAATGELNCAMPDREGVYYQSYASVMSSPFSHLLLAFPYCIIRALEGPNDGLVSVDSAKWGNFRGVVTSPGLRGVSHGDMIDLEREEIKGFDVAEVYVGIVSGLKDMGY